MYDLHIIYIINLKTKSSTVGNYFPVQNHFSSRFKYYNVIYLTFAEFSQKQQSNVHLVKEASFKVYLRYT